MADVVFKYLTRDQPHGYETSAKVREQPWIFENNHGYLTKPGLHDFNHGYETSVMDIRDRSLSYSFIYIFFQIEQQEFIRKYYLYK